MLHDSSRRCIDSSYELQRQARLIADLDSFDVMRVEYQNEYDKACIHTAIESWYGSLQTFSAYVRGPLRQDVLKPMQTPGSISFGYICLLTSPLMTVCLEGLLAMVKAGKPLDILLGYTFLHAGCIGPSYLPLRAWCRARPSM